ncbi:DUF4625 domain-containing protein [Membranihabitans marinus]|uniref:DUF4625 domain-containing protein n=1 Tax=Membranihabitans marinus TaxID=1227546 RepID=UPI001F35FB53|nr:DUF4625 domain-containing protein [Membranihabitans marinus]
MLSNFKLFGFLFLFTLVLFSCSKDDEDTTINPPTIVSFEYGEGSEHSTELFGIKGSDLHLAAEISAEVKVASITLSIHAHDLAVGDDEVEWDFEEVYTDAKYLVLNPSFHEHIDIPSDIPSGEYHIELTVTDEMGNVTELEGHLDIVDLISISDVDIDESVVRGEDVHVTFMVHAVHGIHSISIDAHAHDLAVGDGEVEWDFEVEFLDGYHEETEVEFHEHFDVPATAPAGEYHVVFTVEDEEGNTHEYETHIDVTE